MSRMGVLSKSWRGSSSGPYKSCTKLRRGSSSGRPKCLSQMYSLDSVAQLFKKFIYLNLEGLADLKNLAVCIESEKSEKEDNLTYHDFIITYVEDEQRIDGNITLQENSKTKEITIANIFPNLPQKRNLGITMFWLVLVRGNILAGQNIKISAPNLYARGMLGKMSEFSPRIETDRVDLKRIIFMTVPRLTDEQVQAVEWLWQNVLHCPANLKLNRKEARRRS